MIELACIIAVALLAGFYEWRTGVNSDRVERRFQKERDQLTREREMLLQRIQAPAAAVIQHQIQSAVDQPAVNLEDDEDYWRAQKDQRDALERMEQLERDFEARLA